MGGKYTIGKYSEQGNTLQLPVCLQVHHAIADGYHASLFMNGLQQFAATPGELDERNLVVI